MKRLDEILRQAFPGRERLDSETKAPDHQSLPEEAGPLCPICGDAGFIRKRLPLGHPDFGKAFPCECTLQEQEEERLARLRRYSHIGPLMRLTFENLSKRGRSANLRDQERFQRCVDDGGSFAEEPEGWLVLVGPSGCGKTHLAAAVTNRCLERGHAALFVIVPDLLDELRAAYHPDSESSFDSRFEQVRNAPVLVLDDLGAQSTTEWAREKLFQIINHRYNARLPTLITTNRPLHKLDERLQTRLSDPSIGRVHELESSARASGRQRKLDIFDQPRFRNMTFETFDTQAPHLAPAERRKLEDAYRFALDFAQNPEGWLMLVGPHGSGKTHLAVAITRYRREIGDPPYLVEVAELLRFLREGKEKEDIRGYHEQLEEIREASMLVLDDLDLHRGNPWWEELYNLLNHRYTRRLPTVITTSQTLANLSLDELGERLASLLGDPGVCSEVHLPGPTQLPKAAKRDAPAPDGPEQRRGRRKHS